MVGLSASRFASRLSRPPHLISLSWRLLCRTGYGAYYPKEQAPTVEHRHVKAAVPDSAKDQWALPIQSESRNYGMFYKGTVAEEVPPKRYPPPTRYQSYTPNAPKPDPQMDCSTRPNRSGESLKKPDPAWGYTGHEFARRFDAGDESLSMATRIGARTQAVTSQPSPCHSPTLRDLTIRRCSPLRTCSQAPAAVHRAALR